MNTRTYSKSQSGFSLIELLTVISIIILLSLSGITIFSTYKASAAYGVLSQTYADARRALEAGINDIDNPPGPVPVTTQLSKGDLNSAAARDLMPAFQMPPNVKITLYYDPTCNDPGCDREFIQLNHCNGEEYLRWVRFGDGLDVLLEHLAGVGCG